MAGTFIVEDRISGIQYYMPEGASVDPSKYKTIPIEERAPGSSQTVASGDIGKTLYDQLSQLQPQGLMGQGGEDLSGGIIPKILDYLKPGIGAGIGGGLGTAAGLAMAPATGGGSLALPFLMGLAGSAAGKTGQDLISGESPSIEGTAEAVAGQGLGGPALSGGKLLAESVLRKTLGRLVGMSPNLKNEALSSALNNPTISMEAVLNRGTENQLKSSAAGPGTPKAQMLTQLLDLENKIQAKTPGYPTGMDVTPRSADSIRGTIGSWMDSPNLQKTGIPDAMYNAYWDAIRIAAKQGDIAAQKILQDNLEQQAREAITNINIPRIGGMVGGPALGAGLYGTLGHPLLAGGIAATGLVGLPAASLYGVGLKSLNPYAVGLASDLGVSIPTNLMESLNAPR